MGFSYGTLSTRNKKTSEYNKKVTKNPLTSRNICFGPNCAQTLDSLYFIQVVLSNPERMYCANNYV